MQQTQVGDYHKGTKLTFPSKKRKYVLLLPSNGNSKISRIKHFHCNSYISHCYPSVIQSIIFMKHPGRLLLAITWQKKIYKYSSSRDFETTKRVCPLMSREQRTKHVWNLNNYISINIFTDQKAFLYNVWIKQIRKLHWSAHLWCNSN